MTTKLITDSFAPIYGQPCWGLHYQAGLNLSMNFGSPSLRIEEPRVTSSSLETVRWLAAKRSVTLRGQWWLWLLHCHWRLSRGGNELARRSSSQRRIERAIAELSGESLTGVDVNPSHGATRFTFDLGCVLECRRSDRNRDDDLWYLYKPQRYCLAVQGTGTYTHGRSNREHLRRSLASGKPIAIISKKYK